MKNYCFARYHGACCAAPQPCRCHSATTLRATTPRSTINAKCAKCHRANKSLPKTANHWGSIPGKLSLRTSKMNREEMIAIIEKGKDKMPGFEKELTKEQITDIVDYIIFLKNQEEVSATSASSTPMRLPLIPHLSLLSGDDTRGFSCEQGRHSDLRSQGDSRMAGQEIHVPAETSRRFFLRMVAAAGLGSHHPRVDCRALWKRPSGWGMCRRGLP